MSAEGCAVEGCVQTKVFARGWCSAHWSRWRRTGSVGSPEVWDRKARTCKVDGCDQPHKAHGYCLNHGRHVAKGGHPDYVGPSIRYGEDNGAWKGSEAGYAAAHERVYNARGSARNYACVDCGEAARHWSYNHTDPQQNWADGRCANPIPYSTDPAHYSPRCVPCHKRLDLAHAALRRASAADVLAGLRETREADQRKRFAELLGGAR